VYENASTHDLWKIEQNTTQIIEKQAIFITTDHTFIKNISIQKKYFKILSSNRFAVSLSIEFNTPELTSEVMA